MLNDVIAYVHDCFSKSANKGNYTHFEHTVNYLLQLKPDADEAMQIAAYAHDIDRAFHTTTAADKFKDMELDDPKYLRVHQQSSAKIITSFLQSQKYNPEKIARIHNMILHHEEGGNEESDLIKDADSLSYFKINALRHVEKLTSRLGKDKIRRKFDFMYNRITSSQAKSLATPLYFEAVQLLDVQDKKSY
ncbi:MAG: DUF4202 family protein [Candidatus Woesearchaeota archaeon]